MKIRVATDIQAPRAVVWGLLADVGGIARWNTGLTGSRIIAGPSQGEGAERACLAGRVELRERVERWEPEKALGLRWTKLPMPGIGGRFAFLLGDAPGGGTQVVVEASTTGPLAWLWHRTFKRALSNVLRDLKAAAEAPMEAF
ncbi:MAG: SRPBCC family protein [Thermoplasmatota archaeon]